MKTGNRFLAVMRRGLASVVSIIMTIVVSGNCLAQTQGEKKSRLLTFERTVHDFGEITNEDGVQECSFKYKNQTDTTILIYDVKVFCNCTKVEWPRKPIKPREEGEIKVKYDNEGTFYSLLKSHQSHSRDLGPDREIFNTNGVERFAKITKNDREATVGFPVIFIMLPRHTATEGILLRDAITASE